MIQLVFIWWKDLYKTVLYKMTKYIWLTENMSHSLTRQGGDEGAEEGANEGVGEKGHVQVLAGGVQQTGNCREQIGY